MKKLFLILSAFLPFMLKAQVPGYENKRFILSYNLDVLPNLTYLYLHLEQPLPVQILFGNHLNAEYVLARRFSIAADASFAQNKTFFIDGNALVTSETYGLNFIFYPNHENTLAPVGNYFRIRTFTGTTSANGTINNNNGEDMHGNQIISQLQETAKLKLYDFGVGWGNNMIIKDRVVITASVNLDLDLFNEISGQLPQGTTVNDIGFEAGDHLLDSYLFYFKLGVGGLLF